MINNHHHPDEDYFDNIIKDSKEEYDDFIIENNQDEEANLFFNINGGSDDDSNDKNIDLNMTCAVKPDPKYKTSLKGKKPIFHQRAVKTSFSGLIKIRNKHHKRIFIETIQMFVLKNTEIAVCCGMIMHHVVMNCVANKLDSGYDWLFKSDGSF